MDEKKKWTVFIQPENIRDVLSEDEMKKLTDIIDKLLQKDMQLELAYSVIDES